MLNAALKQSTKPGNAGAGAGAVVAGHVAGRTPIRAGEESADDTAGDGMPGDGAEGGEEEGVADRDDRPETDTENEEPGVVPASFTPPLR